MKLNEKLPYRQIGFEDAEQKNIKKICVSVV